MDQFRSALEGMFRRGAASPGGTRRPVHVDDSVNRRFARGVDINLKVVIRGDCNTGKTSLLRRLRGGTFLTEYEPSEEITTANVPWSSRENPGDRVKLEVWDVVDKAPPKKCADALYIERKGDEELKPRDASSVKRGEKKTSTYMSSKDQGKLHQASHSIQPLDAQAVDVYRGADAVIFMVDPSKRWTYDYVKRAMVNIPSRMPVAIVLNFRDMPSSQRQVRTDEVAAECELTWDKYKPVPCCIDASMLNCYGLKELYSFLHFPYLFKKRAALEQAIKINSSHLTQLQDYMQVQSKQRDGADYNRYVDDLVNNGLINDKGPDAGAEGAVSEVPMHVQQAGASGFGGGPAAPPPTKLQKAGEMAVGAGAAAALAAVSVGSKILEKVVKPAEQDSRAPPSTNPELAKYEASRPTVASSVNRYGSDNPKGSVVNSSSSNADSSRQDQASHRYEQYESKQRQVHLNHKGGVQANAVGGHLLPEDQGGIDEEFFKSDQEKAAEASSAQAATPSKGLGGWFKGLGRQQAKEPASTSPPAPPPARGSAQGTHPPQSAPHPSPLDLDEHGEDDDEGWGKESDDEEDTARPTVMRDFGESEESDDERAVPKVSTKRGGAAQLNPASMKEAASNLSVTELASKEETEMFFANSKSKSKRDPSEEEKKSKRKSKSKVKEKKKSSSKHHDSTHSDD
mmetsp:Transcript_33254/g.63848  ORF Transcript_33254/g.63848 Transcript_33254/m.63848 type:complete len:684 (-) Transcript_33254:566-2617(-)